MFIFLCIQVDFLKLQGSWTFELSLMKKYFLSMMGIVQLNLNVGICSHIDQVVLSLIVQKPPRENGKFILS